MKKTDLLSTAINLIAPDGSLTQQPNAQTYYQHPQLQLKLPQVSQPKMRQPKMRAVEVLLNALKKKVQQLEDQKKQRKTKVRSEYR